MTCILCVYPAYGVVIWCCAISDISNLL